MHFQSVCFKLQGMNRHYEKLLKEYLAFFPCVALIGPRQCGKTTLLQTLPRGWRVYDLEKQSDFQSLSQDPDLFFRLNPDKIAIDEAQLRPELFSALRVAVDEDRQSTGRFVITGSSSPKLVRAISESLAGRIGIIEMAPFSFSEVRKELSPPFFQFLTDRVHVRDFIDELKPLGDIRDVHEFWFRGGYPEPWLKKSKRFHSTWMNQYVGTYLYRDVAKLFPGINENRFRLFVQILAGISGNVINYSDVARSLGVSQPTVRDYFEIADGTFLWRTIPSYTRNTLKRVVKHPKGYFRDSGLLHYLLRIPDTDLLATHPVMGRSWEGLVIEEIIRGLNATGAGFDYYYYRTGGGAEVDLILEGEFGLIPIEIKYTQTVPAKQLRAMKDFIKDQNCGFGLVINNDECPRLYDEQIAGIPFACL
ncbi:MAG: ATP-binding protein [Desulfobacterales bacterium]|uniref:ATP-binding protein n=1 Tax=Candidatus Desulfatibia vada TaxID=2841696 RepID=A0A8J6TWW3_9BACT|nr:ATP-binding protein [Candidatus Desulfatibia vada]